MEIKKIIKNSDTYLSKEKRHYLTHENVYLTSCSLNQMEDEFELTFSFNDMTPLFEVTRLHKSEKYRALANCANLEKLRMEYYFPLQCENLVYDVNLMPRIIMRDAPQQNDDFINEYKALIGEILYPKYKYEDYYLGGRDLYKKKSILKQIAALQTADDIKAFLLFKYADETKHLKKHKLLVSKRGAIATRITLPILSAALVALCVKGYFVYFKDIPYKNGLIQANSAYIAEDYLGTQKALSLIETEELPFSEKYILARSSVITESLTAEQKKNILAGITLKTDERLLNYWIEIGRLSFSGAIDYAKRLGDDELLLFALIKESALVKDNSTLAGEEKAAKVKALETEIKTVSDRMEKNKEELLQKTVGSTNSDD